MKIKAYVIKKYRFYTFQKIERKKEKWEGNFKKGEKQSKVINE